MNAIGIDPDCKDLALALWGDEGPISAEVVHLVGTNKTGEQSQIRMMRALVGRDRPDFWRGVRTIAIEGQQIDRRTKRPADLFTLAHVTGAAALWMGTHYPDARIIIPTPSEWKGGVAKHAHQGRMYLALGWGSTVVGTGPGRYARPTNVPDPFKHISPGQWKHIGDALLLARWAYEHNSSE
jgi:hypothetical protein